MPAPIAIVIDAVLLMLPTKRAPLRPAAAIETRPTRAAAIKTARRTVSSSRRVELNLEGRGAGQLAAVDDERGPGDERCLLGAQPDHSGRDLFGLADSAQRHRGRGG